MKAIVCRGFNIVIATVNPVYALGLDVQRDTSRPTQFSPYDPVAVGAVHVGPLQAGLSIERLPVWEEHVPGIGRKTVLAGRSSSCTAQYTRIMLHRDFPHF